MASLALVGCRRESTPVESGTESKKNVDSRPADPQHINDRYVVFERDETLHAVVPGGPPSTDLGIPAGPKYAGGVRGIVTATHAPLMSPDGRTLAHLIDGELWLSQLPNLDTYEISGIQGPILIGSWSPDGHALFAVSDQPSGAGPRTTYVVDAQTHQASVLGAERLTPGWGFDHTRVLMQQDLDGRFGLGWATLPKLDSFDPILGLPHEIGRTIADARAGMIVGRWPGKVWIRDIDPPTAAAYRVLIEVPKDFGLDEVRLSPSGRHIALCIEQLDATESNPPGRLTVVPTAGGPGKPLADCQSSWPMYWYDDNHIVIGGAGAVYWVGLDGEFVVLAEGARLVEQRQWSGRQ